MAALYDMAEAYAPATPLQGDLKHNATPLQVDLQVDPDRCHCRPRDLHFNGWIFDFDEAEA